MPLHDDEMNMRREKREAQRRKQQAEAKRLRITLILAAVVLAVFISWNRYTAAVTPTETTGASVGSAGLSYGAVLTGGIKQLLGIGREERFAQIMQSMGQAFLYRRVCLVGAPIMAVSCILLLFTAAFVAVPAAPWLALWAGRSALPRCIFST